MHLPGSALEGGAVLEGEGQAAIRVGRGIIQQAAPELFAEGGALMFGIYIPSFYKAFLYWQERREEILKSLEQSEDQIKNHPESLHSIEELDQMLQEEFGYIPDTDKETDEENNLHNKVIEAQMRYNDYSKKMELEELLRNIQQDNENKED